MWLIFLCDAEKKSIEKIFFFFFPERNACLLTKNPGVCKGQLLRFYYDAVHEKCKKFFFSGCGGNGNRFGYLDTCQTTCAGVKREGRSKCTTVLTAMVVKNQRCIDLCTFGFLMFLRDVFQVVQVGTNRKKKIPTRMLVSTNVKCHSLLHQANFSMHSVSLVDVRISQF